MRFAFLLLLILLAQFSVAQKEIQFKGIFENNKENTGKKIIVSSFYGTTLVPVDTFTVKKNGTFAFNLILPNHPGYYRLSISDKNYTDVILKQNENPVIVFLNGNLKEWKSVKNSNENQAILNGHLLSKIKEEKNTYFRKLFDYCLNEPELYFSKTTLSYIPLNSILPDTFPNSQKRFDYVVEHYFDHVNFSDEAIIYSTLLPNIYMRYLENYTSYDEVGFKNTVDFFLSKASKNETVHSFTLDFLIRLFKKVGPEVIVEYLISQHLQTYGCIEETNLSQETKSIIEGYEKYIPGSKISDIAFMPLNPEKDSVHLLEILKKNKLTCVIFWSSYCHFCDTKAENWKKIHNNYKKKGFEVIYISVDTDTDEWKKGIEQKGLNGIHVCDLLGWDSKNIKHFNVNRTPYVYLFSSNGTILLKDPQGDQLENYIMNFFR